MLRAKSISHVKRSPLRTFRANWELLLLCIPAMAAYVIFQYIPMVGLVMPFKNFKYPLGLFGSPWIGVKNFEFLFRSVDLQRIVRNTVGYGVVFIIVDTVVNIGFALLLFDIKERRSSLKVYQTIMTFPNFMSWVIVGFVTYAVLNPTLGVLNQILRGLGLRPVEAYTNPSYWPFILPFVYSWKGLGMGSMMYLAALLGVDTALYEAATIDGASRFQQVRYISIPSLVPLWSILTIMAVGGLFRGDFGLFYQISKDVKVLYETTDIIDTYVFRGLRAKGNNWGMSAAVGFVQSVVGLLFVGIANYIVSKISPDNAMF